MREGLDARHGRDASLGIRGGWRKVEELVLWGWLSLLCDGVLGASFLRQRILLRPARARSTSRADLGQTEGAGQAETGSGEEVESLAAPVTSSEEYLRAHVASPLFGKCVAVCRGIVQLMMAAQSCSARRPRGRERAGEGEGEGEEGGEGEGRVGAERDPEGLKALADLVEMVTSK
jgi:hypothetical protein